MKIIDLRSNHLLEIVEYLTMKDLITFESVCKHFQEFLNRYKDLIQKSCISQLGLEYAPDLFDWKRILKEKFCKSDGVISTFMPFYTNGGTYANSPSYFIGNLIQKNTAYCTTAGKNILVKYAFSETMQFDYNRNPLDYQIADLTFYLPDIENSAEKNQSFSPFITKISIAQTGYGYTCPIRTLMCFSSQHKIEDFSLISNFHSCDNRESVIEAANQMNIIEINPISQEVGEGEENKGSVKVIQFAKTSNKIQVLCWVQLDGRSNTCEVKLCEGRLARYFYLLAINANNLGTDQNIDILDVIPYASLIQIREKGNN